MSKVQLEKSKDNYDIFRINKDGKNCYIGSKYCQKRELDKFINLLKPLTEKDNYIVLGLGTLEHLENLIEEKHEKSKILVVEVEENIIKEAKKLELFDSINDREDVTITNDVEVIKMFLRENVRDLNIDYTKMVAFSNYNKVYNKELVEAYKILKDYIVDTNLERNTRLRFKNDWVNSNLHNSKYLSKSLKINCFKNKYKDIPAIIVSAGPSLEKNIGDIDENKAYIISGGRTLKSLLKIGIDPDFMTVIDGCDNSYYLVKDYLDKTNTNLIYNEMTNSKVLNNYSGHKIVGAQGGFIKEILGEDTLDIVKGGSVANAMTFVAAYMGFNPIIFVGQDLAYTGKKGHAECAKTEGYSTDASTNYYSPNDVYVKSIDGGEVRTSLSLKTYKEAMEAIIASFDNIKFINSTEGGAFIEGAENMPLRDVLKNLPQINNKSIPTKDDVDRVILNKTINGIKINIKACSSIINLSSKASKILIKFKNAYIKNNINEINKINNELNKIELKINKDIKKLNILNSLIYELSYELEANERFVVKANDTKEEIVNRKLDFNKEIYDGMNKICSENIEKLKSVLEELENEKYSK